MTHIVTVGGQEYYVTKEADGKHSIAGAGQHLPASTVLGMSTIDVAWQCGKATRV